MYNNFQTGRGAYLLSKIRPIWFVCTIVPFQSDKYQLYFKPRPYYIILKNRWF